MALDDEELAYLWGLDEPLRTAILEEGPRCPPLGIKMVDTEFMKSREFQLTDIACGFSCIAL